MSRAREIADLIGGPTPDIILKTADGAILNLQTSDTTVTDGSVLGKINFQAPNEGSGTDSILIAASIQAEAEGTFSASNNATSVIIYTGESEAAETDGGGKFTFDSFGQLFLKNTSNADNSIPALRLETGDTDIAADDLLGRIMFTAPDEGAGTDAIALAAEINAISEGNFSSSNNATTLQFATGSSGNANVKFRIASDGSLSTPTLGTSNVRFGVNAGNSIASGGNFNTVVGDEAGTAISTGDVNTFVGYAAGDATTTSGNNVGVGSSALGTNILSSKNVAVGVNALKTHNLGTAGDAYNIAIGHNASENETTGIENTMVGAFAGGLGTLASRSVGIGYSALYRQNPTSASNTGNIAIGYNAGSNVTTGTANTMVGAFAGAFATTTVGSVFIGNNAGLGITGTKLTGNGNVAIGNDAGKLLQGAAALNVLIGANAGDAITTGPNNIAIGFRALNAETQGQDSVAVGVDALTTQNFGNGVRSGNVGIGLNAGKLISDGVQNTLVGTFCGQTTDDGDNNTAMGFLALQANCADGNTAVGVEALKICTGSTNTAIGKNAGNQVTSGGNLTCLGHDSGKTGSPGGAFTTGSNAICIGDENVAAIHIEVAVTVASDARDKTDFTALDLGLDFVKALAPVTYKWDKRSKYGDKYADDYDLLDQTPDGTHKEDWLDIGFKAQEVQALEEAAGYTTAAKKNLTVSTTGDGKQMGLQYGKFVPILVKAIQEQNALIVALTARVATLEG